MKTTALLSFVISLPLATATSARAQEVEGPTSQAAPPQAAEAQIEKSMEDPQALANSEAADQWFTRMRKAVALAPLSFDFIASVDVPIMMGMGGEPSTAKFNRHGKVVRSPEWGTLTVSSRGIDLPDMPMEIPEQKIRVLHKGDHYLCDIGKSAMAMPGQPVGLFQISNDEAQKLNQETHGSATMDMIMGDLPLVADPIRGLEGLITRTAFELVSATDQEVILKGKAGPGLSMPSMEEGAETPQGELVLHLDARSGLPRMLALVSGEKQEFSVKFSNWERPKELDAKAFELNPSAQKPGDLAAALRTQREKILENSAFVPGGADDDYEF